MIIVERENGVVFLNENEYSEVSYNEDERVVNCVPIQRNANLGMVAIPEPIDGVTAVIYTNEAQPTEWKSKTKAKPEEIDNRTIEDLISQYAPGRGMKALEYYGIRRVGQLTQIRRECIRRIRNVGGKTMRYLDEMMSENHLVWGDKYIKAIYRESDRVKGKMLFDHIELTDNPEEWTVQPRPYYWKRD